MVLQGSFFTHYFRSGLLGPADSNGDGEVSVYEACDYLEGPIQVEAAESVELNVATLRRVDDARLARTSSASDGKKGPTGLPSLHEGSRWQLA